MRGKQHPIELESLWDVDSQYGFYWIHGKRAGRIGLFKEGEYLSIGGVPSKKLQQFVYDQETDVYKETPFIPKSPAIRILIGITTCGKNWGRQQGQLDTWIKELPPYCAYHYHIADGDKLGVDLAKDRIDVLTFPAKHGYKFLRERDMRYLEWAVQQPDWEWVIMTDDDIWLDIPEIVKNMTPDCDVITAYKNPKVWGIESFRGALRVFRRDVVLKILECKDAIGIIGAEDFALGAAIARYGYCDASTVKVLQAKPYDNLRIIDTASSYAVAWPNKGNTKQIADWLKRVHGRNNV